MRHCIMLTEEQYNDLENKAEKLEKTEELLNQVIKQLKQITNSFETYGTECSTCKYKELGEEENPCRSCCGFYGDEDNLWEWRGDSE